MIPVYDLFSLPYLYAGAKMYDFVAGARTLFNSKFMSREETLHNFPTLNARQLVGSVVYVYSMCIVVVRSLIHFADTMTAR